MGMTIEKCYLYGSCKCQTAGCVVLPDEGCPVYRYFKDLIVKDYENRLKDEREKIAEDVADKMDYMDSCLNEKNIILGIITGKRETLDSLCSTCKSESCVSNGTAISKADYNKRLKSDMAAMFKEIQSEIRHFMYDVNPSSSESDYACNYMINIIQQKINSLNAGIESQESEDNK